MVITMMYCVWQCLDVVDLWLQVRQLHWIVTVKEVFVFGVRELNL